MTADGEVVDFAAARRRKAERETPRRTWRRWAVAASVLLTLTLGLLLRGDRDDAAPEDARQAAVSAVVVPAHDVSSPGDATGGSLFAGAFEDTGVAEWSVVVGYRKKSRTDT